MRSPTFSRYIPCAIFALCFFGCSDSSQEPLDPILQHLLEQKADSQSLTGIDAIAKQMTIYANASYDATQSYRDVAFRKDPVCIELSKWAEIQITTSPNAETYIESVLADGERAMERGNISLLNRPEFVPAIYILPKIDGASHLEPKLVSIVALYVNNDENSHDACVVVGQIIRTLLLITSDKKQLAENCADLITSEVNTPTVNNASATFAAIDAITELGFTSDRITDALDLVETKYVGSDIRTKVLKARAAIE